MANNLTGNFDVVAEFAILAVDRVLAAMHRAERFPHSMTLRVRDNAPPGSKPDQPTIVGSTDTFGDPTVDHTKIGSPVVLRGQFSAADPRYWALDPVVNADVVSANVPPVVPSKLQGRAQLQLFPPKIEVTDTSGSNITVKLPLMARYFPDPHTPRVAEFVRGELQITAPVDQVASPDPQNVRMIDVDIRGDKVSVNFDRKWSSQPVSAEDLAGVNLLIRNALRTSFLPSNNPLPSNVNYMQFKTLLGAQSAIAALLNMARLDPLTGNPLPPGNPASMNNVFLGAEDAFAVAAGKEFILGQLNFELQVSSVWEYTVSLDTPKVDFQDGKIVVTITGHARSWLPDLDFTAKQAFTLNPAATTPGGQLNTAELAFLGDISLEIHASSWVWVWYGWVVDKFKGLALASIRDQRNNNLQAQQPTVRDMLSVDPDSKHGNLGVFVNSLLKPVQQKPGDPSPQELKAVLEYTSVEIRPSGIVLHGSLTVPEWPLTHVEFEQIPGNVGGGIGVVGTSGLTPPEYDYTALRSWIPGGTIQRYEWSWQGQVQAYTDENRFVWIHPPPAAFDGTPSTTPVSGFTPTSTIAVSGYTPLCLTVRGVRYSSSGPVVEQPVSATVCGYNSFPILDGLAFARSGALPLVALTQPGPGGLVEVAGYAAARPSEPGRNTPNRIVHFADDKTAGALEFLVQGLRESKREDAATAVLAVLAPDQLAKARYTAGVIYAEDQGGAWERAFGMKTARRPLTLIVGPKGDVVWQHEGELDSKTLAAALRKHLAPIGAVRPRILRSSLRIGQPPPNFLFELAPGRGLTLRKLVGRATTLVFWKSSSKPSMETVRDVQETTRKAGAQGSVVLAINDGEAPELVKKVAAEHRLSAILVADPQRSISLAYGVNIWPTIVFLDAFGLVRGIRYGRFAGQHVEAPSREKAAAR